MVQRIAVLGDSHFPGRARELPEKILFALRKFSPTLVIFTGDATSGETFDKIAKSAPGAEIKAVKGEKDYLDLPTELVLELEGVKMGVVHGEFAKPPGNKTEIENYGRSLGVQAIIFGHSHKLFVGRAGKLLLVNPGSFTGIPLPGEEPESPSAVFLTLEFGRVSARSLVLSKGRLQETTEEFVILPEIR